jgi:hypothetical protein
MNRDLREPLLVPVELPDPNKGLERRNRTYIRTTLRHLATFLDVVELDLTRGTHEELLRGRVPAILHVPEMMHQGYIVTLTLRLHIKHFINVDVTAIEHALRQAATDVIDKKEKGCG